MKKPLNTILIGTGGYAETYLKILLDSATGADSTAGVDAAADIDVVAGSVETIKNYLRFITIVDPYAKKSPHYERFKNVIPVYEKLEDCFNEHSADFTIISTPIHLHYDQCITALEHGSHVLCEKPLVPCLSQFESLEEKCKTTGKTISVGFQQCYTELMRGLKKRILSGEFGKPVRLKALTCWPRDWDYFGRAAWPGKLTLPGEGLVRDSVITNATSHYLQNILFLLGEEMDEAADLKNASFECYKANDIETFDTIILRGTASNAEVYFSTTHAVNYTINPMMVYKFEEATIISNLFNRDDKIEVHHKNGNVEHHGTYYTDWVENKPLYTAMSILGEREFDCPMKMVKPFTKITEKIFTKADFIPFPDDYIVKDSKNKLTYVKSLHLDLLDCFNSCKLPSEAGLPWAKV